MSKSYSDIKSALQTPPFYEKIESEKSTPSTSSHSISMHSLTGEESKFQDAHMREMIRYCISLMEKRVKRFETCLWFARLIEFLGLSYLTKMLSDLLGQSKIDGDNSTRQYQNEFNAAMNDRQDIHNSTVIAFQNAGCHTRAFSITCPDGEHICYFEYGLQQLQAMIADRVYDPDSYDDSRRYPICPLVKDEWWHKGFDNMPPEICKNLISQYCNLIFPLLKHNSNYYSNQQFGLVLGMFTTVAAMAAEVFMIIFSDIAYMFSWPRLLCIPLDCCNQSLISNVGNYYGIEVDKTDVRITLLNFKNALDVRQTLLGAKLSPKSPLQALLTKVSEPERKRAVEYELSGKHPGLFNEIIKLADLKSPPERKYMSKVKEPERPRERPVRICCVM